MNTFPKLLNCDLGSRLELEDTIKLVRPDVFVVCDIRGETARFAQALGFEKVVVCPLQFRFPYLKRFFGALAVIDIDQQMEPAEDTALRTAQRQADNVEPAIDTVGTAMAAFDVVGMPNLH